MIFAAFVETRSTSPGAMSLRLMRTMRFRSPRPAAGTPGSVEAGQGGLAAAAGREELTGSGTSVPPPQQVHLSGAGEDRGETPALPDPATGPRLNPDGSSDSGYDEFRFRR